MSGETPAPTPGPNTDLPALPIWESRAFWLTMIAAATAVGEMFGFNVLTAFGVVTQEAAADKIMLVVQAVAVLLALGQRAAPNYRLTLTGKRTDGPTLRSPYLLGAALLGLLLLAACGADGRFKSPQEMTAAELCANAQTTVAAMKVTGAWPGSIIEAEKTAAAICAPAPVAALY